MTLNDIIDALNGQNASPIQAAKYLNQIKAQSLDEIKEALLACDKKRIADFQTLAIRHQEQLFNQIIKEHNQASSERPLNNDQSIHLLQAITEIPFHELNLSSFKAVITNEKLLPILKKAGAHLLSLNLTGCTEITNATLLPLSILCPNLIHLKLNGVTNTHPPSQLYPTTFTVLKGNFQKLITLELNGCEQLTTINVTAPELKFLSANGCTSLQRIQTQSLVLQTVSLTSCTTLTQAGINNLSAYAGSIQTVTLDTHMAYKDFKERFSFLIMLPLRDLSETRITAIETLLEEKGLTGNQYSPHIKEQIYQYLKTCYQPILIKKIITASQQTVNRPAWYFDSPYTTKVKDKWTDLKTRLSAYINRPPKVVAFMPSIGGDTHLSIVTHHPFQALIIYHMTT